ncbi:hypothetical protein FHX75_14380 [Micromonospora palomenae]|uniref:Uncharacterized protein n=1 Tax=Micromonospora palomenae TaxID=1461247 RepID=A0A561VKB3_9ACTN|nr:hypothetical protein [Micromonospora palomenae]TWG12049.1 hypothetical protein FHX75_14380 [Micromonospora palomenae]
MSYPPNTPTERALWNAVVDGVRAAGASDRAGFEVAVSRLRRLPRPWTDQVLDHTAELLAEEIGPPGSVHWPLPVPPGAGLASWARADPSLLALLSRRDHRRPAATPSDPEETTRRLLLITHLALVAQVGVGAFLDVALVGAGRSSRPPSGLVPHCRLGR